MTDHPRVFISYAQESAEHADRVLALANRLRHDGVEAIIDRYFAWVETGWRAWMSEQIESADWVLVVCTEEYRRRFDGKVPADAEALPGRRRSAARPRRSLGIAAHHPGTVRPPLPQPALRSAAASGMR